MSRTEPRLWAGPWERLLRALFPARCLLCGERVPAGLDLCERCEKRAPKEPFLRRYRLPEADGKELRILSPFPYREGFRRTLLRFKFRGKKALAEPLSRRMAAAAAGLDVSFDGVTWVPLTDKGKKRRGYDQSRLLAEGVAKALGLPCLPLLQKVRETGTQHRLSGAQRGKNVKGAYRAVSPADGQVLLLVDDIVTTGATLMECAGVLYRAGAKTVFGLCAADAAEGGGV